MYGIFYKLTKIGDFIILTTVAYNQNYLIERRGLG